MAAGHSDGTGDADVLEEAAVEEAVLESRVELTSGDEVRTLDWLGACMLDEVGTGLVWLVGKDVVETIIGRLVELITADSEVKTVVRDEGSTRTADELDEGAGSVIVTSTELDSESALNVIEGNNVVVREDPSLALKVNDMIGEDNP